MAAMCADPAKRSALIPPDVADATKVPMDAPERPGCQTPMPRAANRNPFGATASSRARAPSDRWGSVATGSRYERIALTLLEAQAVGTRPTSAAVAGNVSDRKSVV